MKLANNFLILLICILHFTIFFSCKNNTLNKNETDFSIQDTSRITKIIIFDSKNELIIQKQEQNWYINEKIIANSENITRIMNTIKHIKLKSPLPENAILIVKEKILNQTKVEFFDNNQKLKSFYLGDYVKGLGNYIMIDNSETPYIAYIPTYDFDINLNFSTDIKNWTTNVLFSYTDNQIKEIRYLNYKFHESFCLQIKNTDSYFIGENCDNLSQINYITENLEFYLSQYYNVKYSKLIENSEIIDFQDLKNDDIIFEMEITDIHNITQKIVAYDYFNQGILNKNEFLIVLDEKIYIMKYVDFDLLMKNYTYFLEQ